MALSPLEQDKFDRAVQGFNPRPLEEYRLEALRAWPYFDLGELAVGKRIIIHFGPCQVLDMNIQSIQSDEADLAKSSNGDEVVFQVNSSRVDGMILQKGVHVQYLGPSIEATIASELRGRIVQHAHLQLSPADNPNVSLTTPRTTQIVVYSSDFDDGQKKFSTE